jgi:tyrocidine synthetase III
MKPFDKKNIENILSLSPIQEGMLFHYLKDPQGENYFEQLRLDISGEIDLKRFEQAWNHVIEFNELLRTLFRWKKLEHPVLIVLKAYPLQWQYYDFSMKDISEKSHLIESLIAEDRKRKFNLGKVAFRITLCQLEKTRCVMIISNHHILYDGWSNGILLKEFFQAYHSLEEYKGNKDQWIRPQIKSSFKEFVQWVHNQDKDKQCLFWREYLLGFTSRTELAIAINKREKEASPGVENHLLILEKTKKDRLELFTRKHRLTLATLFYCTWGILLQRYCGSQDVVFGTTVSGRSAPIKGIEDMVGLFINTIPLRIKTATDDTVMNLLARIDESLALREIYESTPLVDIKEYSAVGNNEELFESIVVIENYPLDHESMQQAGKKCKKPLTVDSHSMLEAPPYDLSISVIIGNEIEIHFFYNPSIIEKSRVLRLSGHFGNILKQILDAPVQELERIELLSGEEKHQLLYDFNASKAEYPQHQTIHALFEEQAEKLPNSISLVAPPDLDEGNKSTVHITYRQLNKLSNQLAHTLKERGIRPETIVGVMAERSLEMVTGVLAVLKAGGAYLPIDPEYPQQRIEFMLKDSNTESLLVAPGSREKAKALDKDEWVELIEISQQRHYSTLPLTLSNAGPSNLAYIIYTSGSTGQPKGVLIQHRGVVNMVWYHREVFDEKPGIRISQAASPAFDAMAFEVWPCLLGGAALYIIDNETRMHPDRLKSWLIRHQITLSFQPTLMAQELLEEQWPENAALEILRTAGEKLNCYPTRPYPFRLYNLYGPTEDTIWTTWAEIPPVHSAANLNPPPIGKPVANKRVCIFSSKLKLQPVGVAGELCISGDGLARGYLNRPELTAAKFLHLQLPGESKASLTSNGNHLAFYKTGDLARWLEDGNIEFLGRMDNQVKIRGYRIELGEIESCMVSHPEVKEAVVIDRVDNRGNKILCAYVVPCSSHLPQLPYFSYLSGQLPAYMVPAHFMALDKMPLTPNGKIDRKALPDPEIPLTTKYIAPGNKTEEHLVEIWSDILGIDKEKIGIDENFFELGGHSIKAARLIGRIHKTFDIEISFRTLFDFPTIRGIYDHMNKTLKGIHKSISLAEEKEYYPLAVSQKRFYIFQTLRPEDASYNITETMLLEGELQKEKMEAVLRLLLTRHECLRTSFHMVNGEPVQRFHREVEFDVKFYDLEKPKEVDYKRVVNNFVRPFDLTQPPLWRVALIKAGPDKHYFTFDIHHLIADGTSIGIFIRDFNLLYSQESLLPLIVRFRDFVEWQQQKRASNHFEPLKTSVMEELENELLNLPTDFPRSTVQAFEGSMIREVAGKEETAALRNFCLRHDATLYMVLLAAFNVMLSKLSGQKNIAVGSPIAGRGHVDFDNHMGLFLHTLCLRNRVSGKERFTSLLKKVKQRAVNSYENQDYQYDELVKKIKLTRDSGRNPLFDVMLVLQNMKMPEVEMEDLKITRELGEHSTSKFDITLYCEEKEPLVFLWEYSTALFKEETMRRYIRYFWNILSQIQENPHQTIGEIEIITEEEKHRILYDFNDTSLPVLADKTIHQLVEEQAEKTPGNTAVIWSSQDEEDNNSMTYKDLNQMSNRLARLLKHKGAGAGTIIGLMMDRSLEMVTALLGILKAGAAYLPIDPEYPDNRIACMLDSSDASMLLIGSNINTKNSHNILPGNRDILLLPMDELAGELEVQSLEKLAPLRGSDHLIYIIFTSGSTGIPKGAGVLHRGFLNLMHWFVLEFGLDENDCNLLITSLSFDLTQKNLYASLMKGGALCLSSINYFEPRTLLREIRDLRVTWLNCTPSMFHKLVESEEAGEEKRLTSLRYVFLGGEPIFMPVFIQWLESPGCRVEMVNTYGPTECTDICNYYRIKEPNRFLKEAVPIGKPVYNVRLYIPNSNLQLQPVGVPGELLIGGAGVGIGYINDKDLTSQKFILHSFEPKAPKQLLYRTGDLVKWLPDGNIEFLGRIDHQVKVRGFRIELSEIENRLLSFAKVKEAVVMAREKEGMEKYLCAYIVPCTTESLKIDELRDFLAEELPGYMIPHYFLVLEKLPMNPNGKVDRKALPEPDVTSGENYIPPRNEKESILTGIWEEVLGIQKKQIGIHDNFFLLGGDSLKAATLIGKIHKRFSAEIPIAELFKKPTIEGISGYINETGESIYKSIRPVEEKEYYPLSSPQKRLFLIYQMAPKSTAYNLPEILELKGVLDKKRLKGCFEKLLNRHESLRSSFVSIADEPVQIIDPEVAFDIRSYNAQGDTAEKIIDFIRPFDLSKAPLLRAGLIKIEEERHLLMIDMHHIITDGLSVEIFTREFTDFYAGNELPPLQLQYKDFSQWQIREIQKEAVIVQKEYWQNQFAEEIPVLHLPTDYPRPAVQQFEGRTIRFEIGPKETVALEQLALTQGVSMYMILLSLYTIFLSKITGQEDIIVGTPVAGRNHSELHGIIGMFVNTLGLRNYPQGGKTFCEFLEEVKTRILDAFENQDYPFENLVDMVVENRDLSRNPLFDTVFIMQNMEREKAELPGLKIIPYEHKSETTKFDLTLIGFEKAGNLEFIFEYSERLFKESTIRSYINYFTCLLDLVLANKDRVLSGIEIITEEEKQQILIDFNDTATGYPRDKSIHELFTEHAASTPNSVAMMGKSQLQEGKKSQDHITYSQLNEKSTRLSQLLIKKGTEADNIVGLMGERSVEMIIGILGILKAGAAYLPIDPNYPPERIDYMLKDSRAKVLLTTPTVELTIKENSVETIDISKSSFPSTSPSTCQTCGTNLAYIIYTSGSTGRPKGVMVEHRNVIRLVKNTNYIKFKANERILQTGALEFDASTFEIWSPLLNGLSLYLAQKEEILDAKKFKAVVRKYNIGTMWLTSPLFNRLSGIDIEIFAGLGNLLVGGDVLSPIHIKKLRNRFPGLNIINGYGPTENTTFSTTFLITKDYMEAIPIGKPIANSTAHIIDGYNKLVPIGVVGQLCVGGEGVARGYLNKPELSAKRFIHLQLKANMPPLRLYKTGDLARWLLDGNIEFIDRVDQQVKIRGFRIEPGEIEKRLLEMEEITEALVIPIEQENKIEEKYLCAYIVTPAELDSTILRNRLSSYLPDYMIPSYFMLLEKIPLTPNGKINHKALPEPQFKAGANTIAPRNSMEQKLAGLWLEVLGKDKLQQAGIGIDDNFFQLGGHSLKAATLISQIHKSLNVNIPLVELFRTPTIRGLSQYIESSEEEKYYSIEKAEEKPYYTLSSAQNRLFVLHRMEEDSTGYNIPSLLMLEGDVTKDRFEKAFKLLITRHESLRTSFHMIEGVPVQKIHPSSDIDFKVGYYDSSKGSGNSIIEKTVSQFFKPFELSQTPLLRVGLAKVAERKHLLMVDMHHIISDGTSIDIFLREFMLVYNSKDLPEPVLQYKDFCQWQNRIIQKESIAKQEAYWLKNFDNEIPVLDLPTDFPRPAIQGFEGDTVNFEIDSQQTERINELVISEEVTLYMVLLTIYNILMAKLSGNEQIVIGTPTAGRRHPQLQKVIGMFVNTIALKNSPNSEKTFREFLYEVRESTLSGLENQDYPFEDLVEQLDVNRNPARNPIFDVMFVLQNMAREELEIPGVKLKPYNYDTKTAKFDLTLMIVEREDDLLLSIEYCVNLFRKESIKRFSEYFKRVVSEIINDTGKKLVEIEIISQVEKNQVLYDFNNTELKYPGDKTIHELVAEQSARTPDSIAMMGTSQLQEGKKSQDHITYSQLNEKSTRLAHLLLEKGTEADNIVGLMGERSVEMIIGILGILKAGAAYLPIDPNYPQERIDYMLKDSRAKVLLTTPAVEPSIKESSVETIDISKSISSSSSPSTCQTCGTNLAYIIYTSGSTGRPKGVMVEHRNVIRLVKNTNYIKFKVNERILQTGALEFDASTFEIWSPLLNGLSLYLAQKEDILDAKKFKAVVRKYNIGTMWLTSPLFNRLSSIDIEIFAGLGNLLVGGDVLSPNHINMLRNRFPGLNIINGYGPTENTTFSTTFLITKDYMEAIPIGKPIANSTAHILDGYNKLVPIGVVGQLCVGGEGVARGYLNKPELSAKRFIHLQLTANMPPLRLYNTGDLARWLPDGNIEFIDRVDQQVKIRGFRIEPGEIEKRLLEMEEITEALVIPIEQENKIEEKYLCAYIVTPAELDSTILRNRLSSYLPDYMIPSYFMLLEKIPLTPNGKINHKALPEPQFKAGANTVAPRNSMEQKLAGLWLEVLGKDKLQQARIGIDDNFFQLGGHSLKAATLISQIHKSLNVNIPLVELFRTPTIRGLSQYIESSEEEKYYSIEKAEEKAYYTLSSAQNRLYVLHRMEEDSTGYNIPSLLMLEGDVTKDRFEHAFKLLITRHESLRTSFHMIEGVPVQKIHPSSDIDFKVGYYDSSKGSGNSIIEKTVSQFFMPFELSQTPLLRVGLAKVAEMKHLLMVDMHHIISDGTSIDIFLREFMLVYNGKDFPEPVLQYKDFCQWQNSIIQKETITKQEAYWLKDFDNEIPVLDLPTDFPRPAIQSFEGSTVNFELDNQQTKRLNELVISEEATLYMVLLAIYNILLAKLSGNEQIIIGTPTAGRRHPQLQQIIGMFVNTIALKNSPKSEKTFREFLYEVRESTLSGLENQDYPFEDLVEQLDVNRDPARNPIFDVMFALQNMAREELKIPGVKLKPYDYDTKTAKFDLDLNGIEAQEKLLFTFQYSSNLFKPSTIKRFVIYFKVIVAEILENSIIQIKDIEILSVQEKERLLFDFNNTQANYSQDELLHELFAQQAAKSPHHIAVTGSSYLVEAPFNATDNGPISITYKKLNDSSNSLAYLLRKKGVAPGMRHSIVAVKLERSVEMIIAILGILKAGGAYLPIPSDYPEERIGYILTDSKTGILVTDSSASNERTEAIDLPRLIAKNEAPGPVRLTEPILLAHLCYIIYTSGTTGRPKGVLVEHQNIIAYLNAFYNEFEVTAQYTVLQQASYSFDAFVEEVYPALLKGGKIVIPPKDNIMDIQLLSQLILRNDVNMISCSPLLLNELNKLSSLNTIHTFISGGDVLKGEYIDTLIHSGKVYNTYGPTETTVCATYYKCLPGIRTNIPLGKPISNYRVYLLDKNNKLQPAGIPGELCISGDGTTRGYLNRVELTQQKFIPNPFIPGQKIYKSGDLGRWLSDGNIEFLGRIDHQVKIRGYRIELGEIESQLLKHDEINEAVVMCRDDKKGDKFLCAYITATGVVDIAGLKSWLSNRLPNYMIPANVVYLEQIPLTGNGKIDREALPTPDIKIGETYMSPRDSLEEKLAEIWENALGIEKEKISINENFFQLGGHSLKAIQLAARLDKELNVKIPIARIFNSPTIMEMAEIVTQLQENNTRYVAIEAVEEKEYYPLSSAQKRLYILNQMDKTNTRYNMPMSIVLEGEIDKKRLEETFWKLINRHEILRTSFIMLEDEPVQKIHKEIQFKIEFTEGYKPEQELVENFLRPFDISRAPLLRSGLIKTGHNRYLWIVDMYHIVSDGFSSDLLVSDFVQLYNGTVLAPLRLQYKDFSQWQNRKLVSGEMEKQENYWLTRFQGDVPHLELPTDFKDVSAHRLEKGQYARFELEDDLAGKLHQAVNDTGSTVYIMLLAVFNILLSRYTKQEDIVVGAPVAGRRHIELEKIIGMFVNMLAMRNAPQEHKTFGQFLEEVRQNALDAYENQDYQFETFIKKLGIVAHARNPLCNVVFVLQNANLENISMNDIKITPFPFADKTVKFDLQLEIVEYNKQISMVWNYPVALFRESTVAKMANHYIEILAQVLENREIKLRDILLSHELVAADTNILQEENVSFGF